MAGKAGQGGVRPGVVRRGKARQARLGKARLGKVGMAWQANKERSDKDGLQMEAYGDGQSGCAESRRSL